MHWRKKHLQNSKLYLILDCEVASYQKLFEVAKKSISAGVDVLQLRAKFGHGREILEFSKAVLKFSRKKALYIVNDRIDLAFLSGADGVHLGQDDVDLRQARELLNKDQIVGVSCQEFQHLRSAQKFKADYIGFGSVFKTLTKPNRSPMELKLLKKVVKQCKLPVFAIGGIYLENIDQVMAAGIKRVAVCRAICQVRDVKRVVKDFKFRISDFEIRNSNARG